MDDLHNSGAVETKRGGSHTARRVLAHLCAALLAVVALGFVVWFVQTNPALPGIFAGLAERWSWGGGNFERRACLWTLGALFVFCVTGALYLEGLELYLPPGARLALAFLFGMGLCGFVLELLAIPYLLHRPGVGLGLAALLGLLALRAWWRFRRPAEAGTGDDAEPGGWHLRRTLAQQAYRDSLTRPRGLHERVWRTLALALITLISLAIAWHAILYPEVYWDSLILYLGYARQTFLAGGFPVKVTGQVGMGLGANYPHLFSVLGSGIAAAMGHWSELPQRIIAPLCGVAATVLIYNTALRLTRHVNFALAIALLYRATPIVIGWDQYASDYALALLFGAGFLYLAVLYVQSRLRGYLWSATLLIALAMHLNYLMGILWLPWVMSLLAAHLFEPAGWPYLKRGGAVEVLPGAEQEKPTDPAELELDEAPWVTRSGPAGLRHLLAARGFWLMLAACGVIGSTWLVRNYFVTGNPVYAFFYKQLGGININPEVMKASEVEWQANGWGIGLFGKTLAARLHGAWTYFVLATPSTGGGQAYLLQPLFPGFAAGGLLVWLAGMLATPWALRTRPLLARQAVRAGWVIATLALALLAFHFILAPFYLYQIIDVTPCLALLVAAAFPLWRLRPWRWLFGALVLWVGLVPGLAMALMGFKVVNPFTLPGDRIESPLSLYPLRHPLPETLRYYQMRFGDDALMWDYVNKHLKGIKLLTHENRDLVYDASIELVNLDDWEMQQLWREPDMARRVARLAAQHDIHYYLRIPNEAACPTNAKMGTAQWEHLKLMRQVVKFGESTLYELTPTSATAVNAINTRGANANVSDALVKP